HSWGGAFSQSVEHAGEEGAVAVVDHEGSAGLADRRAFGVDDGGCGKPGPSRVAHRLVQRERRADRAPGGVLDGRGAERRVEPGPAEALDAPPESQYLLGGKPQKMG